MAAFRASRLVWLAISSIVSTMAPISSERMPISSTLFADSPTLLRMASMPAMVSSIVFAPSCEYLAAWAESRVTDWALLVTCAMAVLMRDAIRDALLMALACSWAPLETVVMVCDIFSTEVAVLPTDSASIVIPLAIC